jgi:hypothetical protein
MTMSEGNGAGAATVTGSSASGAAETATDGAGGQSATGASTDGFDWEAEAAKWKTNSQKNEVQAKQNAAAAKRLAELEREKMTDQQRASAELDELRAERESLRQENRRLALATRYGIDADNLDLIGGGTDEEMEARAKRIAKLLRSQATAATSNESGPRRPRPDSTQGTTDQTLALNGDPLLESVKRALKIN